MGILIQAAQLLTSLSILIVLHELGHFIPAKLFKTRVEKFYLFFDPYFSLFKVKKGETEYGIGWLPLGGYVKISGMIDESMDKEQMKEEPKEWEFRSKKAWQRLIIMLGGVTVNLILGMLIYIGVMFVWGREYLPVENAKFGTYFHEIALDAGFEHGDKILLLGNDTIGKDPYNVLTKKLLLDQPSTITVDRGGEEVVITLPENYHDTIMAKRVKRLFTAAIPFQIDSLLPKKNAIKAGFQKNDIVSAVNGVKTPYAYDALREINSHQDTQIVVTVERQGKLIDLPVETDKKGTIGIGLRGTDKFFDYVTITYTFAESIPAGIKFGTEVLTDYVEQFKLIFTPTGATQIGGFGTIGSLFPTTWDWQSFWMMTAFLSIILAFMNILPIPALDGGHAMFVLYEMITRRKPSEKFLEYAQMVGFILLVSLLLWANGLDLVRAIMD